MHSFCQSFLLVSTDHYFVKERERDVAWNGCTVFLSMCLY